MKKGIFMKYLLVFLLSVSLQASDESWSIQKEASGYSIKSGSISYKLEEINVVPKIIETKKYGSRFEAVVYFSNSVGTSVMIDEYYAALFDHKEKRFIGSYPYLYKPINPKHSVDDQPVWKFDGKTLNILEDELGINKSFQVN